MPGRPPLGGARLLAITAALTGLLLLPGAAPAATVRVDGAQLRFIAAANEANLVSFERTATAFRVFDSGADLEAGAGCAQGTDNVASCPHAGVTSIRATLGNLDDSASVEGPTPAQLFGQQGTDTLIGSTGDDTLDAGPGVADFLAGRDGADVLDATDATGGVKLDGGGGDDTLRGNDAPGDSQIFFPFGPFVLSGMPGFVGGDGNDTITGSNTSDVLFGGAGADTISGGTGGVDSAFWHDRNEELTINLSNGGATDGGPTDNGVVNGTMRRDSLVSVEGVMGGNGSDEIIGSAAADTIAGGLGNDVISGAGGGDVLCGDGSGSVFVDPDAFGVGFFGCASFGPTAGDDRLNGGPGDDAMIGGLGADRMNGGADVDSVSYNDRALPIKASIADTCAGDPDPCARNNDGQVDVDPALAGNQGERDTIGLDVEQLSGGSEDDILSGSDGANRIEGDAGDDDLLGGDGDDILCGDSRSFFVGAPVLRDGPCNDTLSTGEDALDGEEGDDVLAGTRGRDMLNGGPGDDTATWQERSGTIGVEVTLEDNCAGTPCAKNNDGQVDVDPALAGEQGERDRVGLDVENVIGTHNPDTLAGSGGRNIIIGLGETDTLSGLGGPDVLEPNGGTGDVVDGGAGRDFVSYRFEHNNVTVTIDNVANDGTPFVGFQSPFNQNVRPNIEGIMGTAFSDNLSGPAAAARNTLLGYGGNDTIQGFAGDDTLDGGSSADSLRGGTGNDLLTVADGRADLLIDCDDGAAPGGGASDRVVFDSGLETPVNCENQSPLAIAAGAGPVTDPRSGAFKSVERRLAGLHRFGQYPSKAKRAARRAARKADRT